MSSSTVPAIDPHRVRRLFMRRGPPSFIVREIAARMNERLDLMKLDPKVVLDLGCGAEPDRPALQLRYPKALLIGIDLAPKAPIAPKAAGWDAVRRMFARRGPIAPPLVAADFVVLPLASASAHLIWSNCALHWLSDAEPAIAEWARVLKPDGALLFSCFGPDSLREVRDAFAAVDIDPHTVSFTDLHDYGDMLASHGFAQPVMDMERLTLTYADAETFWRDVRDLGGNPLFAARRGLLGRAARDRLDAALLSQREPDGLFRLSVEIVTGHAWKGRPRNRADGLAVVAMPTPQRSRR